MKRNRILMTFIAGAVLILAGGPGWADGPSPERGAYLAIASLLPGSLPVGEEGVDAIVVHCLDVGRPIAEELRQGETLYRRAVGLVEAS